MNTLPKDAIGILNKWLEKHPILLPKAVPSQNNNIDYSFSVNDTTFHGPYGDGDWLQVEQQESDKPRFIILWNQKHPGFLFIYFYSSISSLRSVYHIDLCFSDIKYCSDDN